MKSLFKITTIIIGVMSFLFMTSAILEYIFNDKDTFGVFLKSLIVFLYICLATHNIETNK